MTSHQDTPHHDLGPAAAFDRHIAAFNAHDTTSLLAGLAPDAVWVTGRDSMRGADALAGLFSDELWALDPHLGVRSVVHGALTVAAELTETLLIDRQRQEFVIAVFLRVRRGLIEHAKVYREGTADL